MNYVVAVKYGIDPASVNLPDTLAGIRGVTVSGANEQTAHVKVDSEQTLARLRSAVGEQCHIEEEMLRRPSRKK
jgi:hypothetical protein